MGFVRSHAQQRVCELRHVLMTRTILAHNKPLPQGRVPIPGDASDDGDYPATDTAPRPTDPAPRATFAELQQAAQLGQWNTRGTPPRQMHVPQSDPVDQGHGDRTQRWDYCDESRIAPRFDDRMAGHQPQFGQGEHVLNPHAPHYQAPHGVNAYSQLQQHDGGQTFMPQYDGHPPHVTGAGNMGHPYPPHEDNWLFQYPSMGNPDMSRVPPSNTWGSRMNIQSAPTQNNQFNSNGPAGQGPQ